MPNSGFQVSTLLGCRLVEVTWPQRRNAAEVRDFVFTLYDLWDSEPDVPSVALNDLRAVEAITADEFEIMRVILARMRVQASFVAGAFYVGDNEPVRSAVARALEAAKRPGESLCRTRGEAVAYLRNAIAVRGKAVE
ncbi:MAG: hypothetical protein IPF82_07050 [Blastocatellia bacterium]|nr:hypothetical protein [Blastocatellia bacterium]